MLNKVVTIALTQIHPEAVTGAGAIFEQDGGQHLHIRSWFEQGTIHHADVPKRQVVGRHGELAGSEHPPSTFLGRRAFGPEGVTLVAGGVSGGQLAGVCVVDVVHTQGHEDAFLQQIDQGHAADLLHNAAGDYVVGVGILPLRAGVEIQRLFAHTSRMCCAVVGTIMEVMT